MFFLNIKRNKKHPTLLIGTGGTGGHIYPSLVVASLFKEKHSEAKVHFIGTLSGMEKKLIGEKTSHPLHLLRLGRLNKNISFKEQIKTLFQLPLAFLQCFYYILKIKPSLILGMGGQASGPLLLMGVFLRKKTLIWEPNVYPGLSNRILSKFVDKCLIVFEETKEHLMHKRKNKIYRLSYPVRKTIESTYDLKLNQSLKKESLNLLVLGGSQGARYLNNVVFEVFKNQKENLSKLHIIHQTGEKDFSRMKHLYEKEKNIQMRLYSKHKKPPIDVEVKMFLDPIDFYYKWAELVLSRSGTGTLFELAASRRPSILIPLPHSSDNHQMKNAEIWAKNKATFLVPEKNLTLKKLTHLLLSLKKDPKILQDMSNNTGKFYSPSGRKNWIHHLNES